MILFIYLFYLEFTRLTGPINRKRRIVKKISLAFCLMMAAKNPESRVAALLFIV